MRIGFFAPWALVLLLWCVSGAGAQSTDTTAMQSSATLKIQAANGDPKAQFKLAGRYLVGAGVPQSTSEALVWFHKAAGHGDAASQFMLGQLYEDGGWRRGSRQPDGSWQPGPLVADSVIPKDFTLAAKWYRKAAEQGNAVAQNHLGTLYENGKGVPQDYSEAYFWLSLAEANGSTSTANGVDERDLVADHLTKTALIQTQERARKWFEGHPSKPQ